MWREKPLSNLANIIMGQSPPSESYNDNDDGLPFLQGCSEFGARYPIPRVFCSAPGKIAPAGSVLISVRAPVGELNSANAAYCIGRGLAALSGQEITSEYIYYYMNLTSAQLERLAQGSTFEAIGSKELREHPVLHSDSHDVREEIVSILTCIDTTIEKTEALIAKYEQIKRGMMQDFFTRGLDEAGRLRPPPEEALDLYHETELGLLPKGWRPCCIEEISQKVTDGDHHTPLRSDDGILLLSARNVLDGRLSFDHVDYVPEYEYQRMILRCHPEAGDVLVSCSGTVGRVSLVPTGLRFALVRSVALIKVDQKLCSGAFMAWALRTSNTRQQILASQLQAAQPNLFQGPIMRLLLPVPGDGVTGEKERMEIVDRLNAVQTVIDIERNSLSKLRAQKAGLMQDLLTGKVRVKSDTSDTEQPEAAA